MFKLKNIINWSSVIFTIISIYVAINFYPYNFLGEAFIFEGASILLFIFMINLIRNLPLNDKIYSAFFFVLVFSSIFLALNTYLIIPLTLTFLFYFRNNLYLVISGLFISIVIAYTLNTFVLSSDKINITIETLKTIPSIIIVLFIIINLYLGWIITDQNELLFTSGLMIFVLLMITWIYNSPIQNRFLLTIPFFLLSIKNYRVDRFLGKVYH